MVSAKARLLVASVSLVALGAGFSSSAMAANVEGVRQEDSGTIAVNLYDLDAADPPVTSGADVSVVNVGGTANALAQVLCAEASTCPDAGALEQFASGTAEAHNRIDIAGTQTIHAIAEAVGANASATALIDAAVSQVAIADSATNELEVSGALNVLASAAALATQTNAYAAAGMSSAIQLSAIGGTAAAIDLDNDGTIQIEAIASADAIGGATADSAFATAFAYGINAHASATGPGDAAVALENAGALDLHGEAHATADQQARVRAAAIQGMAGNAVSANGNANVALTNSGAISLTADAAATADHTATGIAVAAGAMVARATSLGVGDATASMANSGTIVLKASMVAQAGTNVQALAFADTGVYDIARAATGDALAIFDNSGSISLDAKAQATGLVAQASAEAGGPITAGGAFQSAAAADGSAHAVFDNSGEIAIAATADANGSVVAYGLAIGGPGVIQFVFATGGDAAADLVNSGSIDLSYNANANATNSAFATAFAFNGIVNSAFSGPGGDALVDLVNDGTISVSAVANAIGPHNAGARATESRAVGQLAFAFGGDAQLAVTNSGAIAILASAAAAGSSAAATANVADALFQDVATVGTAPASVSAVIDNSGSISFGAFAEATGKLAATAIAHNQAIAQNATAHFIESAFVSGASSLELTTVDRPIGPATVRLDNSGTIAIDAVAAAAASEGTANALATVEGLNQSAIGTDASVSLDNGGTLGAAATANADGVGSGVAIARNGGIVQLAQAATDTQVLAVGTTGTAFARTFTPSGHAMASIVNSGELSLLADASAMASGPVLASASVAGIVQSAIGSEAQANIANSGTLTIAALAAAEGTGATAFAVAAGFAQFASAIEIENTKFTPTMTGTTGTITVSAIPTDGTALTPVGPVAISLENTGTLDVRASALAEAQLGAFATAELFGGTQDAGGTSVDVALVNSGEISFVATASAVADTFAAAGATNHGLKQFANATTLLQNVRVDLDSGAFALINAQLPAGPASASLVNSGSIDVIAQATANAVGGLDTGTTFALGTAAFASAYASGLGQFTWGTEASGSVDNSGSLIVAAQAQAVGIDAAQSRAFTQALRQGVNTLGSTVVDYFTAGGGFDHSEFNLFYGGPATVTLSNGGTIAALASATATASQGPASATADARGIALAAAGTQALIDVDNSGTLSVGAFASASGTTGRASAVAAGVTEAFTTAAQLTMEISNSGVVEIAAGAHAVQANGATAIAAAVGLMERGSGLVQADFAVENSGTIDVSAFATAEGGYFAGGTAFATGVTQRVGSPDAQIAFDNSGSIAVTAAMSAAADAETGFAGATAFAHGYSAIGTNISADVDNSGSIQVIGQAVAAGASGWASATAAGVAVAAIGGTVSGTIANAGTISVLASASGVVDTVDTRDSTAEAVGILAFGGTLSGTIENSGTIDVTAIVGSEDGTLSATGIRAEADTSVVAAPGAILTINNSGDLIVRESVDGGSTFTRGMAIDVALAPNPAVINLLGGGNIYGDIDIDTDDAIVVSGGETLFNGVINPECMPAGGPTALTFDDAALSACGQGPLTIADGGNLHLVNDATAGPSYAFVDTFTVAPGGTITFDIGGDTSGTQPIGSYSQVYADVANLDGTLVANIVAANDNGLFQDDYFVDNLIDANTRNGTFDTCVVNGIPSGSLLLQVGCVYDDAANVDLGVTRVAFDQVPGLNGNGTAVGSGLECLYDPDLTGGIANLLADLFLIDDQSDYRDALNQLAGASYASYLHSFQSLGVRYNELLDNATSCEIPALAGSVLECRTSPVHVWGQVDFQHRNASGDSNIGRYESDRWSMLVGADMAVGNTAIVGASLGRVTNRVDSEPFNDLVKAHGWQFGAYGVFDPGAFYVKALGSYSSYDGDSVRHIDFTPFGGTFGGEIVGDPDVKMWTLGLHAGARLAMGANSALTPYANLDYVNAKMQTFTEEGLDGANLTLNDAKESRTTLTAGVKYATDLGGVVPEVNLGYRYQFGDRRSSFNAFFLDDADGNCDFDIVSADEKRGAFLAGASIGGKAGPVDIRVGYQGLFGSDVRSHAGNFRIILPFGGAPAPAPVVEAPLPPPPPPPPVAEPAPVIEQAPPPPPPPAPSGERGM